MLVKEGIYADSMPSSRRVWKGLVLSRPSFLFLISFLARNIRFVNYCLSGSLRTIQPVVGRGPVERRETQKRLEGRHRGPAAVESERELLEVAPEVLVADAVMGTAEPLLFLATRCSAPLRPLLN